MEIGKLGNLEESEPISPEGLFGDSIGAARQGSREKDHLASPSLGFLICGKRLLVSISYIY